IDVLPSSPNIFCGEELIVNVRVSNPLGLPVPWVKLKLLVPPELGHGRPPQRVISLGPGQTRTWEVRLWSIRRGLYSVGPLIIETGDPLGAASVTGRREPFEVRVFPQIVHLERPAFPFRLSHSSIRADVSMFEDRAKPVGVRDYAPEDDVRRIHWKLTARAGSLKVREFEHATALETLVFLNLDQADYELRYLDRYSELAITVAASLITALGRMRQSVGLGLNGSSHAFRKPGRESGHLIELLTLLATCSAGSSKPFQNLVEETAGRLAWGTTLALVTPQDSGELMRTALGLKRSGFEPIVLVVNRKLHHPEILSGVRRFGVGGVNISSEEALESWGKEVARRVCR
ncbi:MAG: DUF58 domain-containing protein, partial [Firmicutes bacterium]|nr:DUF58 domain-containing protein [Bacillota bacterium]